MNTCDSFLNRYKKCDPNHEMKLKKVYLYWICPDTNAFEWFVDLLKHVEDQMLEMGDDFLNINIFWTRGWNSRQVSIMPHKGIGMLVCAQTLNDNLTKTSLTG